MVCVRATDKQSYRHGTINAITESNGLIEKVLHCSIIV